MVFPIACGDTEHNNGVLIYLLFAERDVEIVADRGFNIRVSAAQWEAICRTMEARFGKGEFEAGLTEGINPLAICCANTSRPTWARTNNLIARYSSDHLPPRDSAHRIDPCARPLGGANQSGFCAAMADSSADESARRFAVDRSRAQRRRVLMPACMHGLSL